MTLGSGVSQTVVTLETDALGESMLVVEGSTAALQSAGSTSTRNGLDGYIMSGLGGGEGQSTATSTSATARTASTTVASGARGGKVIWGVGVLGWMAMGVWIVLMVVT